MVTVTSMVEDNVGRWNYANKYKLSRAAAGEACVRGRGWGRKMIVANGTEQVVVSERNITGKGYLRARQDTSKYHTDLYNAIYYTSTFISCLSANINKRSPAYFMIFLISNNTPIES